MSDAIDPRSRQSVSVVDPIPRAFEWTRDVLFRPFSAEKWIVLGFCAWLAHLFEGWGGGSGGGGDHGTRWNLPGTRREIRYEILEGRDWALEHLALVLAVSAVLIALIVAIVLAVTWLTSRGKFMFLDGVVLDRAAVVEPWNRYRTHANSLFLFRVMLTLVGMVLSAFLIGGFCGMFWLFLDTEQLEPVAVLSGILLLLAFLVLVLIMTVLGVLINDFLVPLMYLRDCRVGPAWTELVELMGLRPGVFVLYLLLRIVFFVAVTAISFLACCATCCLVLVPYVGTVILLPVHVFLRAYPLYLLGQFGEGYERFATLGPAEEAAGEAPA